MVTQVRTSSRAIRERQRQRARGWRAPLGAPQRNITRLDYGSTHAWWVRFTRGSRGDGQTVVSRMFSDGVYGGNRKALGAAKKWRDRMSRKVPPPVKGGTPAPVPPGYGYVRRTTIQRRVGTSDVWLAWIRLEDGRCASSTSSIERWGNAAARRRAEAYLARKRKQLGRAG